MSICFVFIINIIAFGKVYNQRFRMVSDNFEVISSVFGIMIIIIVVSGYVTASIDPEDPHV